MKKWIIFQTEEVKNYLIPKENSISLAEIFQDEDIDRLLEENKLTKAYSSPISKKSINIVNGAQIFFSSMAKATELAPIASFQL